MCSLKLINNSLVISTEKSELDILLILIVIMNLLSNDKTKGNEIW